VNKGGLLAQMRTRNISNFFFSTNSSANGQSNENQQIHKICLTGGPCAGKTTALTHLQHVLTKKGIRVFSVPEAATLLMKGGAMINTAMYSFDQAVKF
jgi:DNA replication protein DnaC